MVYIRNWADRRVIQRATLHQKDEINISVSLMYIILGPCSQNWGKATNNFIIYIKKSLKILKGQSFANQRRTDNTIAKRKGQKNKQRSTNHTHKTKHRVT